MINPVSLQAPVARFSGNRKPSSANASQNQSSRSITEGLTTGQRAAYQGKTLTGAVMMSLGSVGAFFATVFGLTALQTSGDDGQYFADTPADDCINRTIDDSKDLKEDVEAIGFDRSLTPAEQQKESRQEIEGFVDYAQSDLAHCLMVDEAHRFGTPTSQWAEQNPEKFQKLLSDATDIESGREAKAFYNDVLMDMLGNGKSEAERAELQTAADRFYEEAQTENRIRPGLYHGGVSLGVAALGAAFAFAGIRLMKAAERKAKAQGQQG